MFWNKKTIWNAAMELMAVKDDIITKVSVCLIVAVGLTVVGSDNASADYTFGTPVNLASPVNTSSDDSGSISPDGLTLLLYSDRPGGYGAWDIWITTRATRKEPWGEPVNLGTPINSTSHDFAPSISANGLELYFASDRSGVFDLWVATRATTEDDWGAPVSLGPTVNSSSYDGNLSLSADGLSLYFTSGRSSGGYGVYDLWVTTRATVSDPWGAPVNLGPTVNSSAYEDAPSVSADGLLLFFGSNRPGGYGDWDVWVATRATTDDSWGIPVNLGPTVNTNSAEDLPSVSLDGSSLYFSDIVVLRPGGVGKSDVWKVPIEPVVDLNADGIVDSADMCVMVDNWGTNNSLCDIGPMPWGDGVVDVEDIIVLSEHLFEQVNDPTLVAHWALDETEGMLVTDSAGDNDGYALGDPLWQPDGGQVNGAIQLDGIDDYIVTGSVLSPEDGPLSVFVWIRGGAPGQAIISEPSGSDWLSLEPTTGYLMTELTSGGRDGSSLVAETTITDGNWHRIGLVWDGSYRTLVVDGAVAAEDTQSQLESRASSLYIGTGKNMAAQTFFSGMVDDVRIYNRALRP